MDFPQLEWRPAAASDVPAWAALIARTPRGEPGRYDREADLEQQVASGKNPLAANTVLGLDGGGVIRAYADFEEPGRGQGPWIWLRRPGVAAPRGGNGTSWLAGAAGPATLCRRRRGTGAPVRPRLRIGTEQQHGHQARLLESAGYRVVRYFNEMHRSLDQPLPTNVLAGGLVLAAMAPELHEQVRLAHNEAFSDHGAANRGMRRPGPSQSTIHTPGLT